MIADEIVDRLIPKDRQLLVFRFFIAFSRFEYALKSGGYITCDAKPAWDDFANAHEEEFDPNSSPELKAACDYLENHPPRKQLQDQGTMVWSQPTKRANEPLFLWLLRMARRVRNNLFHGSKYPIQPDAEPVHNVNLLEHTLTIIDACLAIDHRVCTYFGDPLQ
jgi:hypothetical protein